jgi:tetratricopeptide (TPR) repeat protein
MVHQHRGDYEKALAYYERARKIAEELGDRVGVSKSLHQIGNIHYLRRDYERALCLYEQARKIEEEIGDRLSSAISHGQMGQLLKRTGHYTQALEHSLEALSICMSLKVPQVRSAMNDFRDLRRAWGPQGFDEAWRQKTGEDPPQWLRQSTEGEEERPRTE